MCCEKSTNVSSSSPRGHCAQLNTVPPRVLDTVHSSLVSCLSTLLSDHVFDRLFSLVLKVPWHRGLYRDYQIACVDFVFICAFICYFSFYFFKLSISNTIKSPIKSHVILNQKCRVTNRSWLLRNQLAERSDVPRGPRAYTGSGLSASTRPIQRPLA